MKRVSSISNNNSPVAGWKLEDQNHLHKFDNAEAGPEWQLLTEEDWEDNDKEQRDYYCAICKSRLDFLTDTVTIWRCNECMQYYDTSIQDVPIKDMSESKVKVYQELDHYPEYDENDPSMIFVEGINPNADTDEYTPSSNIEVISDEGRHKHIRVKGLPNEALAVMNEIDGRAT